VINGLLSVDVNPPGPFQLYTIPTAGSVALSSKVLSAQTGALLESTGAGGSSGLTNTKDKVLEVHPLAVATTYTPV
jgi:hypothetical protein